WNFCNELSYRSIKERGHWMTGFDFSPYTVGASKEFDYIGSSTIQETSELFVLKRRAAKKAKLRWRKSFGERRSLGWIPFKARSTKYKFGQIFFAGHSFKVWDSYGLKPDVKFRAGCFAEDSRGRWYFCAAITVSQESCSRTKAIGVDLGLKSAAVCSDGRRLEGRQYKVLQKSLGVAQRANKKQRVRSIHAKIRNRRMDEQHKFSRKLVNDHGAIYIGDVSTQFLVKTNAKSANDVSLSALKNMIQYKSQQAGVVCEVVSEKYTTQTCSSCGAIPDSRPNGIAGLGIRHWECECGALHDRDVNAAINILNVGVGHDPLDAGIHVVTARKVPNLSPTI
ncbi:MAG: transposase, partial [Pseudomonadota bacterium]